MASKDRILRQKEETRINILDAAHDIVREEGWQGLNMRKIADRIEYTAPIIYEYFANKDAILLELTKKGCRQLTKGLSEAKQNSSDPAERLQKMWEAFWNFAFTEKELYRVMYGVEMTCCMMQVKEAEACTNLFLVEIAALMDSTEITSDLVKQKYYTFFSVIHGLISLNLVGNGPKKECNAQIFQDAVDAIIQSIKVPYQNNLTSQRN